MVPARSRTRLAKRLLLTACATFVAAGALAYSNGGGQHPHQDEGPNSQVAQGGGGVGGYTPIETQTSDGGTGDDGAGGGGGGGFGAGGHNAPGNQQFASNTPQVYGPGDGGQGLGSDGFMPNGEDGLMTLAAYAQFNDGGHDGNNPDNSDQAPGQFSPSDFGDHGDGSKVPTGGQTGQGGPGGDGFGLGFGGGGGAGGAGGGGSFGGGATGIGGGSFPGQGGGSNPGGSNSPGGGGFTPPGGGSGNPSSPADAGGGDDGGGTICVVSATNTCGGQSPPHTLTLPPIGGSDTSSNNDVPGGPTPGVPEPATWATMILGFGAMGSVLRRRRALAAA